MTPPPIADLIEAARAALRSGGPGVLERRDGAPAIALLASWGRDPDLVLPLREGRNFVGRGTVGHEPYLRMGNARVVEQSQWFVTCSPGRARVTDAASTNPSVLCPAVREWPSPGEGYGFDGWAQLPGALELAHPNTWPEEIDAAVRHATPLREGDVLRSVYAAFVFAWT